MGFNCGHAYIIVDNLIVDIDGQLCGQFNCGVYIIVDIHNCGQGAVTQTMATLPGDFFFKIEKFLLISLEMM